MHFAKKLGDMLPKEGLKLHVHRKLAGMDPARDLSRIHASDLTSEERDYCPREFALAQLFDLSLPSRFVGTSLRYTFDMGRMLEHKLQNEYAADIAVGHWSCIHCGDISVFGYRPGSCHICKRSNFHYMESRFTSLECGASGGVDLLIRLPSEKKLRLVEIKTMVKDEFKILMAPLSEHRLRTSLYLRLVEESDSPFKSMVNMQEGLLFYMVKGFGCSDKSLIDFAIKDAPFSPFKEFYVTRDDKLTDEAVSKAKSLFDWRNQVGGLPNRICQTSMCKRASKCAAKKVCWKAGYAPGGKVYAQTGSGV